MEDNDKKSKTGIYNTSELIDINGQNKAKARARRDIGFDEKSKTKTDIPVQAEKRSRPSRDIKKPQKAPDGSSALDNVFGEEDEKLHEPKKESARVAIEEDDFSKNIGKTFGKAVLYLIFVVVASGIVSYFGITIANDLFSFVKNDDPVVITIDDNSTISTLTKDLHKAGVIKYPLVFRLYNSFKNRHNDGEVEFENGTFTFPGNLNYDEIILKFEKRAGARTIVTLTFPEGSTVDDVIDIFIENGVGTREGFENAVSSSLLYDMDYEFLLELQEKERNGELDPNRKYVLEGYLYPDTYEFYTDSKEIDIVSKFLKTFNTRFEEANYDRCRELGYSVDEIVNIASIIQKETKFETEFETVSSVYHNRLNNKASFPRLQCDSTYLYAFPEKRDKVTLDEMKASDSPYSTYSHDGLPPSPICNPGLDAIIAGLYPNATDSDGNHTYYYMYARKNGYHYFASNESEHLNNIARADKEEE